MIRMPDDEAREPSHVEGRAARSRIRAAIAARPGIGIGLVLSLVWLYAAVALNVSLWALDYQWNEKLLPLLLVPPLIFLILMHPLLRDKKRSSAAAPNSADRTHETTSSR